MARIKRKLQIYPQHSVHKVWRGHNRESNIASPTEKARYLEFMNEDLESEKRPKGSSPQALVLMSNHTHEISFVIDQTHYSNHMRRHHARYGQFFNRRHERCGKVAQDRPHTTLLGDSHHEMIATFYIHANPIRANIVKDARNYAWSTHSLYAFGHRAPWMRNIKLPNWYLALGKDSESRQREYRRLFARYLKEEGPGKKTLFQRNFFGPLTWKQKMEDVIRQWRKEARSSPD